MEQRILRSVELNMAGQDWNMPCSNEWAVSAGMHKWRAEACADMATPTLAPMMLRAKVQGTTSTQRFELADALNAQHGWAQVCSACAGGSCRGQLQSSWWPAIIRRLWRLATRRMHELGLQPNPPAVSLSAALLIKPQPSICQA